MRPSRRRSDYTRPPFFANATNPSFMAALAFRGSTYDRKKIKTLAKNYKHFNPKAKVKISKNDDGEYYLLVKEPAFWFPSKKKRK